MTLIAFRRLCGMVLKYFRPDREEIYLRVAEYNIDAIRFYERFGFKMTGRRFEDEECEAVGASIPELEMVRKGK